MTPSLQRLLVVTAVAMAVAASIWFYRSSRAIAVETVPVARGPLVVSVTPIETGTVETEETALVKAEIAEQVVGVLVKEGDAVKAGAALVRLNATVAQARLNLATSTLRAARARLESARIALQLERSRTLAALSEAQARYDSVKQRYDKKRQLAEGGLVSADEIQMLEADLKTAEAAYDMARANREQVAFQERQIAAAEAEVSQQEASVRVAQLDLEHAVIRAPLDGTVMELPVKAGELVLPGTPVARISRRGDLYIKALIDEVDLGRVQLGQAARVSFDVLPGRAFDGTVSEIAPTVSSERLKSRNVQVKVRLTAPPPELRPGLSADVEIIVARLDDVLSVPSETVMSKDREQFVYMVEDNRLAKRTVVTGYVGWDATEIRSGLQAGEQVVTSLDVEGVVPGARVTVARKKP
jgi:multidrug efflux pump subunit AcrA (membrane-fusion protein)